MSDLVKTIQNAGIVGAGGGGFPTHIKVNAKVKTVIANGAECEPLLSTDRYLMETKASQIIDAIRMVKQQTGAQRVVIALKAKYTRAIEELKKQTGTSSDVEIVLLRNFYPAGDEHEIVKEVTGQTIPEGGIPLNVGVIVINVNTLVNIADAITDSSPVIKRWVTVIGEVENPYIAEVPIGIQASKLIDIAVPKLGDYAVISGGPMMGHIADRNFNITKLSGGILVLPYDNITVQKMSMTIDSQKRRGRSVCDQCFDCSITCPRNLLGHDLSPHKIMRNLFIAPENGEVHITNAYLCCECGLCDMFACPLDLSPRAMLREAKIILQQKGIKNPHENNKPKAHPERDFRRVSQDKLMYRLGLKKYDIHELPVKKIQTNEVSIALKQHLGAAAKAIVKKGDIVTCGQLIAKPDEGALGAAIHSSIKGKVTKVSSDSIDISANV